MGLPHLAASHPLEPCKTINTQTITICIIIIILLKTIIIIIKISRIIIIIVIRIILITILRLLVMSALQDDCELAVAFGHLGRAVVLASLCSGYRGLA